MGEMDKQRSEKQELINNQIINSNANEGNPKSEAELSDSFEKFKKITSRINEFLWSLNIDDNREDIYLTDSVHKITGYTTDEVKKLPGRILSLIHHEDALNIRKQLSDLEVNSGASSITLIYRIINKSGKILWVKEGITVERDESGKITRYDGIVSDISELKEAEFELKKSYDTLKKLNDSKDRFISIISHDLRAPFTSILGFAEILLNEPSLSDREKKEYLTYIYESSQSQLQLVNYLLDWSRLQTGRIKFEPQRIKASTLVYNCVSALTGNAVRKNIEIKVSAPEDINIHADEKLITQAVNNLLSNAIKFTEESKTVSVIVNHFKKGIVEFIIKDEGVGISEANKSKIFKFDQKFSLEGTKGEKGSGLGLALVKEIIEKHGGDVWFYSEQQKGSEFHFTVPEAHNLVLLVEDDKGARMLWQKILNNHFPDFEVISTTNGYEAMSFLSTRTPSLVITDHDMPLMNGIQLIETMRKRDETNKIPVMVVATLITDDVRKKYVKLGVETILIKPVELKMFIEELKNLIN